MNDDDGGTATDSATTTPQAFRALVLKLSSCALDAASRSKRNACINEAAYCVRYEEASGNNNEEEEVDEVGGGRLPRELLRKLGMGGLGVEAGEIFVVISALRMIFLQRISSRL